MKIVITGGSGFIGSHVVRYFVKKYSEYQIINYDKLTYAGNPENLRDVEKAPNYKFVHGDVCDLDLLTELLKDVDCVLHFAAESHVDNSIGNSLIFTMSNTYGTHTLLEAARSNNVKKIIHVSTDEVYGDIMVGVFTESDKLDPNNPYSASKAAAEMIVQSYFKTYKLPIITVRGNNVFGPNQYPEKIIPRFTTDLIEGKKVPLHGDGTHCRTYIYVLDVCKAIDVIFQKGKIGQIYNIGTQDEISNIELTKKILAKFDVGEEMIEHSQDRPFNDRRYSLDLSKIHALGWTQEHEFEESLQETMQWYIDHPEWWKPLKEKVKYS